MADDVRDPDSQAPDDLDDVRAEALFDTTSFDDVRAELAGLPHLDPTRAFSESVDEPAMPDWAWERISGAMASEAAVRAADTHDNVVLLSAPTAASASATDAAPSASADDGARGRHSRGARWGGGLVAASVTLIAVGFGYSSLHTTAPTPAIVGAGRNIQPAAAAPLSASPTTLATAQAFSMEAGAADAVAETPATKASPTPPAAAATPMSSDRPLIQPRSSVVQAARMVTDTGTDYQHEQLSGQVTSLLSTLGVQDAGDLATMPSATALPAEDGFTETWPLLRDCITWLTSDEQAQAVVVDRGTYEGQDAGIVVAPASDVVDPTSPAPTMSLPSDAGQLNVWVIDPSCKHVQTSIEEQMSLQLLP